MDLVLDDRRVQPPGAVDEPPRAERGGLRRAAVHVWNLPLRWHLVGLTLLLSAAAALAGPPGLFSVDEGLAIVQARHLAAGTGWHLPLPFPQIDPTGLTFGFPSTNTVVYGKHPLYPFLLAGCQRVGGVWAMVGLSLLGTVAAAGLAGRLARHLRPELERATLWAVGVGGPLAVDGLTVFAHTLAAALATLTILGGVEHLRRSASRWWLVVGVAAALPAVMLRSEAVLLLGAWAVVLLWWGFRQRERRVILAAIATGGGALVGRLLDHAWATSLGSGTGLAEGGAVGGSHGLTAGLQGTPSTLFGPSLSGAGSTGAVLLLGAAIAVAVGAWQVRRRRRGWAAVLPWVLAVVLTGAAVVVARPVAVPGLFVVCPVLLCGVIVLPSRRWPLAGRLVGVALAAFVVLVLATQYQAGGTIEWGARYLAVGLPAATAVAVWAIWTAIRRVDPRSRCAAITALAVSSALLLAFGVTTLRRDHRTTASANRLIEQRAAATPAGDGGLPVVMTTNPYLLRLGWPLDGKVRWMVVAPGQEQHWATLLGAHGVRSFVLIRSEGGELRLTRQDTVRPVPPVVPAG